MGTNIIGQEKVIRCYNCQGEGHMARQCTKPKRPKNSEWFKEKMLLVEALESGDVLDEEHMEFLADNGDTVTTSQVSQELTTTTIFQTDDLDAFDSDCDKALFASAVFMAKLSVNDSDVLSEMFNQVATCNEMEKVNKTVNESLTAELERYKEQIKIFEQRQKFNLTDREKYIDGQMREESKAKEDKYLDEIIDLEKIKKALDNIVYKMGQSTQTMHMLTKPQVFYDESHKTALGYQNPLYLSQAQRKQHALYCGQTIVGKHETLYVRDTDETLKLSEESKLKMLAKQNDRIAKEKKVNIAPIEYVALNKLSKHFVSHFVSQKQLSAKQAFWLPISKLESEKLTVKLESVKKEVPRVLPKIILVKDSFKKMRSHVNDFDKELLVYVNATCPSSLQVNKKLVAITPMNKNKKVRWKPTGWTFTIDGNKCPLTRITSTIVVPPKQPIPAKEVKKTPPSSTNLGKPKVKNVVAFRKHTCFIHNLEGVDLLKGFRGTNLYTLSLEDMMQSSPIYLLSKASKTKSWLWHQRLAHLNFSTINDLAKQGLFRGFPKLKYQKDHLCFACSLGKSKKHTHKPKFEHYIQEKLYLLHMDLCGPMRIESINGKKYILVIIQVRLNATVCNIRTDKGTEFVNQTLQAYYEVVGISHQTSVARTPQQNGVVERRNQTLVEAARTMLIFYKAPSYMWAEAVATACYTQNRSLIRKRHNKTPYEILHDKKPDLTYFHVFGAL
ncbi:retrovirus-related pol polyprotein from transposon TNT 1-94 [Tanacetum coccineum]